MHDLVIRNGTIIDGTGAPRFLGDIAIDGDTITSVGGTAGPGREEVDATGLVVTPGWVDMHTHYDGQITWDPYLTPSSWHGVTTVVMGNCGVGFAPVKPEMRNWLVGVMEGVEDIPGTALHEGIEWDWETFPEYMDALERSPHAIDYATQIPHSALRAYVMGQRGADNEPATEQDIAEMSRLVREALDAGALGFSTSRTLLHKSADGVLVAGTFATRDELFGIGKALGESGTGVYEIAAEHLDLGTDFDWMRDLATETGQPVVFNMSQTDQNPTLWRDLLTQLDDAAEQDIPIYGQVAGRAIGILMSWRATAHPFALHPTFQALAHLPWEEQLAQLRDPDVKARLLAEDPIVLGDFETFVTHSFHKMYAIDGATDYEPRPEDSVAAIATRTGRDPLDVAYDLLLERDGEAFLYFPLFNYADNDLELLHTLHSHPRTLMGLSDGGAHCGAICDAGMPTFMISFWTRDRKRGATLPLEYMVMRQTSQTARFYGMHDRGVLAPGMKADVNVFDYEALDIDAPKLVWDLPAGGRRLLQRATGYALTVCSGEVIFRDGVATGAMPGKLVRGAQPAPVAVRPVPTTGASATA